MAAGYMSLPGTEYGPCAEPCHHTDCAATRDRAEGPCGLCAKPIGYDTAFFNDAEHGVVHAVCLEATL